MKSSLILSTAGAAGCVTVTSIYFCALSFSPLKAWRDLALMELVFGPIAFGCIYLALALLGRWMRARRID